MQSVVVQVSLNIHTQSCIYIFNSTLTLYILNHSELTRETLPLGIFVTVNMCPEVTLPSSKQILPIVHFHISWWPYKYLILIVKEGKGRFTFRNSAVLTEKLTSQATLLPLTCFSAPLDLRMTPQLLSSLYLVLMSLWA